MSKQFWTLEQDSGGIVWLHANNVEASTNVLSVASLHELDALLDKVVTLDPKGIVLLSDKAAGFIAGADVKEFVGLTDYDRAISHVNFSQAIFMKLDTMHCPTVALINGFCLGGGLELALCCDYILLNGDDVSIGLPEVKLGIHPGFGGTVRLIRKIGPFAALPLIVAGRLLSARAARKIGLADEITNVRHQYSAAIRVIHKHAAVRKPPFWSKLFSFSIFRLLLAKIMSKRVAEKVNIKHYPAPFALIDIWQKHGGNLDRMYQYEAESSARLIISDTAQNLIRLFMLKDRLKKFGKIANKEKVIHVHVVGGGIMGGDIAAWCAAQGYQVSLQDQDIEAIGRAMGRAAKTFKRKLKRPRLIQQAMDRLTPDTLGHGIKKADVIIEAIFENLQVKQELFTQLEADAHEHCILATNTSSLPLDDISQVLQNPQRLVGLHFFNPVAKMPLVEIVHSEITAKDVVERASAFASSIGKLPLPVKSAPGFLVNRLLMPYLLEAVTILSEGIDKEVIDKAALDFGMPMGPIHLADYVGLDICSSVATILAEKLGFNVPKMLGQTVEAGNLGVKSGQGFYQYKNGQPIKSKHHSSQRSSSITASDITDRLLCSLFNESSRCLSEGIVEDADLLDAGVVFGTGFAPHTGGPMHYMSNKGSEMLKTLNLLEQRHGERFHVDENISQWVTNA